jgi:hypothetical protein
MYKWFAIAGAFALVMTALLTDADPQGKCDSNNTPALGEIAISAGPATFYLDDRGVAGNGDWLYQETNGQFGLQRGGVSQIVPGDADTCSDYGVEGPDTLIAGAS